MNYVPILKGKEGEYGALEELTDDVKGVTMPLIEIPDVPRDWERERPAKSVEEHVSNVADRIAKAWGARPVYLDFSWLDDQNFQNGASAIGWVLDSCHQRNLKIVPVLGRENSVAHLRSVRQHHQTCGLGACFRFIPADFSENLSIADDVETSLGQLGMLPSEIDVVVDLGELTVETETALLILKSIRADLPLIHQWRHIILAASSFPQDLSEVDASSMSEIPRREWELWGRVQQHSARLLREGVIYSDYAIAHPEPREMDPRMMRMSASIRYTTDDSWLIVKGRNVRQWGYEQFYELCERLVAHRAYKGPNFSWGDRQIELCAQRKTGTGNATTWRKVATNHHITLVARELANPRGP